MGGVTLSEMRSAYEVTQAAKNWEIIVGNSDNFSCVLMARVLMIIILNIAIEMVTVIKYSLNDLQR